VYRPLLLILRLAPFCRLCQLPVSDFRRILKNADILRNIGIVVEQDGICCKMQWEVGGLIASLAAKLSTRGCYRKFLPGNVSRNAQLYTVHQKLWQLLTFWRSYGRVMRALSASRKGSPGCRKSAPSQLSWLSLFPTNEWKAKASEGGPVLPLIC